MNYEELKEQLQAMSYAEARAHAVPIDKDAVPLLLMQQAAERTKVQIKPFSVDSFEFFLFGDALKSAMSRASDAVLALIDEACAGVAVVNSSEVLARCQPAAPASQDLSAPPAWVQPTGAHDAYALNAAVSHEGYNYLSQVQANVWEPSPQSTLWEVYPDPGPLPWVQPTGSVDAYSIGDKVTYTAAGRDETLWESNIDANVYVPGDDVADRWWKPSTEAEDVPGLWSQPVAGVRAPYRLDALVTYQDRTWRSVHDQNVWEPGIYGWEEVA